MPNMSEALKMRQFENVNPAKQAVCIRKYLINTNNGDVDQKRRKMKLSAVSKHRAQSTEHRAQGERYIYF